MNDHLFLSPKPGLHWRFVRRLAARLRWRALWRRGMRRVGPNGSAWMLDNFGLAAPLRIMPPDLKIGDDVGDLAVALYRRSNALLDNIVVHGVTVYAKHTVEIKPQPGFYASLLRRYKFLRRDYHDGWYPDIYWPHGSVMVPFFSSPAEAVDWLSMGCPDKYSPEWTRQRLVYAARAAGPTPTAEDIEAWAQMAAASRQRTEDMTRDLFD